MTSKYVNNINIYISKNFNTFQEIEKLSLKESLCV